MIDWHSIIAAESHLAPDAARHLSEIGFVVMPGLVFQGGYQQLSDAYDHAVATDPGPGSDVRRGHVS